MFWILYVSRVLTLNPELGTDAFTILAMLTSHKTAACFLGLTCISQTSLFNQTESLQFTATIPPCPIQSATRTASLTFTTTAR